MTIKTKKSTKIARKTVSKKPYAMIVTAKISYGPFKEKATATAAYNKVQQVPRAQVSKLAKTARGYTFTVAMLYGLKSTSQKSTALATIKKHAPTAKVSFKIV